MTLRPGTLWYALGTASASAFGFLISYHQIFAFGRMPGTCNTLHKGFLSEYRHWGCTLFAMAVRSKVFIVVRNKGVVPKQRRVERLPSGYSVRESRDDSKGSYWYVVTALDVVRQRHA